MNDVEETVEADASVEDVSSDVNTEDVSSDIAESDESVEGSVEDSGAQETTEEISEATEQGATAAFAEETASPTNEAASDDTSGGTRSSKRIQQLLAQNQELRDRQIAQGQPGMEATQGANAFQPNEDGEIEMTPDQLQGYINQSVQQSISMERSVAEVQQRGENWHSDLGKLVKDTPQLNPNDAKYNKELDGMLSDLIRDSNTDSDGRLTARILPSEVWGKLQASIDTAKTAGATEARATITKNVERSAITNDASVSNESGKYSDADLVNMAANDPRGYAELIENNEI